MRIGKLRRKLSDPKFVKQQLNLWVDRSSALERFRQFECSSFFKGEERASLNWDIYYTKKPIIIRHIRFLKKLNNGELVISRPPQRSIFTEIRNALPW